MEYILITATGKKGVADSSNLNDQVNAKLKEGFKPYGSPGMTMDDSHGAAVYYQALIKE